LRSLQALCNTPLAWCLASQKCAVWRRAKWNKRSAAYSFLRLGTIAGRLLFAALVVRIVAQRRLLRIFLVPGLIVFSCVYFFAARHSLVLRKGGVFLAALLLNGPFSLWGNYLPRVCPTHLRGTGESFAFNIGARVIGASAAVLTTQLANVMPGAGAAARLAFSAGTVAVLAYLLSLIGSFWLREPEGA
jgi:sugar phosphate permease